MRSVTTCPNAAARRLAARLPTGASSCPNSSSCRIRAGALPPGSAKTCGSGRRRYRNSRPASAPSSALLDPLHVLVAKAQMVADLVDQHVPNNGGEVFAGFAPIVEDRPAVEKHHVDLGSWIGDALMWQRDPAIQAQDVERAFELHRLLGLFVGKFLFGYHQPAEMRRKFARDGFERMRGQRLDIAERGGAACGHRDILA